MADQRYPNNYEYLKNGYYTDSSNKRLRRGIIIEDAKRVAEDLVSGKIKMTSTTLRRFYSKLLSAYEKYKSNNDFEGIVNQIEALIPDAEIAVKREVAPYQFKNFIRENVNLASRNPDNLKGFVRHYQSIICFFSEKK
ncbi:type III-A CRISPR-associated protein Csm2 [Fodinisporobacter ferrooxydans]|uniref:CRISPR system Cms protein Csm2 n=1 Tax=Fodinisporobacter ferrooxydans TaxID=2901836 RepID=A0ABY4CPW9_9BACL|nr:type III-A CRISPR-associated protein Csm2 [Alicyclobacillaceae bacterium MYW30-H2]